ncbi:MAG TPA: VCBS repeat-containing protein, partial [Planctomycetota bacterium]|nr:VCBS repeat-containing protein [Planctomycetota bacterium]
MRHTERMVVVLSCFVACAAAQSQIFGPRERDPFLPAAPNGKVLPIDADGDGRVDLIVDEGSLVFYRNEGPGKFVRHATSPGELRGEEAVGDFDGDGDLDFVGADPYRNVGGGHFVPEPTGLLTFLRPVLFDFDGDGDLDLATFANSIPFGFHLLTNDGAGHFTDVTAAALPNTTDLNFTSFVTLDAERDGDRDLVACRGALLLEMVLLRNDGHGVFIEEPIPVTPQFGFLTSVLAGDLDGDGNVDFATGGSLPGPSLYLNDGIGTFHLVPSSGLESALFFPRFSAWADWDQDGRADLVSLDGIWRNVGNFHFVLTPWPLRGTGTDVHVLDIDGDLDLDYVASGSPVLVTLNTSVGAMHSTTTAVTVGTAIQRAFGNIASLEGGLLVLGSPVVLSNYALRTGMQWQRNRVLVPQFLPFVAPITDAAPIRPWGATIVCDANGATLHSLLSPGPLPGSATATHVGAGDLMGSSDDEIVLGDPAINGPEILVGEPYPGYVLQPLLNLAPATPSSAPVAEAVVIADMDGDGRNDIVHELRVLHNDGDGAFSQVADFALLVGPMSTNLIAIDFDGDGDQDLVVWGGTSPTLLLRNDGDHFVDSTFGHIPSPDIAP